MSWQRFHGVGCHSSITRDPVYTNVSVEEFLGTDHFSDSCVTWQRVMDEWQPTPWNRCHDNQLLVQRNSSASASMICRPPTSNSFPHPKFQKGHPARPLCEKLEICSHYTAKDPNIINVRLILCVGKAEVETGTGAERCARFPLLQ